MPFAREITSVIPDAANPTGPASLEIRRLSHVLTVNGTIPDGRAERWKRQIARRPARFKSLLTTAMTAFWVGIQETTTDNITVRNEIEQMSLFDVIFSEIGEARMVRRGRSIKTHPENPFLSAGASLLRLTDVVELVRTHGTLMDSDPQYYSYGLRFRNAPKEVPPVFFPNLLISADQAKKQIAFPVEWLTVAYDKKNADLITVALLSPEHKGKYKALTATIAVDQDTNSSLQVFVKYRNANRETTDLNADAFATISSLADFGFTYAQNAENFPSFGDDSYTQRHR